MAANWCRGLFGNAERLGFQGDQRCWRRYGERCFTPGGASSGEPCTMTLVNDDENGGCLIPMMMLYHEHDEDPHASRADHPKKSARTSSRTWRPGWWGRIGISGSTEKPTRAVPSRLRLGARPPRSGGTIHVPAVRERIQEVLRWDDGEVNAYCFRMINDTSLLIESPARNPRPDLGYQWENSHQQRYTATARRASNPSTA